MEAKILDALSPHNPMATRKLMTACGVKDTKRVGTISDDAFDFVTLLGKLESSGEIRHASSMGWIKNERTHS